MSHPGTPNSSASQFRAPQRLGILTDSAAYADALWLSVEHQLVGIDQPTSLMLNDSERACAARIIAPSNKESFAEACALAESLWDSTAPCLFIAPEGVQIDASMQATLAGVDAAWVHAESPSDTIAACIRGLVFASHKTQDLQNQLRIAERLSKGMSGEMDRLHEEFQLAATVQRESLPQEMPQSESYEIETMYRPQGFLSGDTYDVVRLDTHNIGVFIADAVGHGAPAALMTMVLARSLQTHGRRGAPQHFLAAGHAIRRLNGSLMRRKASGSIRFATAAYLTIDENSGEIAYASAGHPHALVYNDAGLDREVESQGAMLGVFDEAEFPESMTTLAPGETLIVHSDGFEQVFGDESQAGDQRGYRQAFACLGADTAAPLLERMHDFVRAIDERAGSLHQMDDLTLIAVRRKIEA